MCKTLSIMATSPDATKQQEAAMLLANSPREFFHFLLLRNFKTLFRGAAILDRCQSSATADSQKDWVWKGGKMAREEKD